MDRVVETLLEDQIQKSVTRVIEKLSDKNDAFSQLAYLKWAGMIKAENRDGISALAQSLKLNKEERTEVVSRMNTLLDEHQARVEIVQDLSSRGGVPTQIELGAREQKNQAPRETLKGDRVVSPRSVVNRLLLLGNDTVYANANKRDERLGMLSDFVELVRLVEKNNKGMPNSKNQQLLIGVSNLTAQLLEAEKRAQENPGKLPKRQLEKMICECYKQACNESLPLAGRIQKVDVLMRMNFGSRRSVAMMDGKWEESHTVQGRKRSNGLDANDMTRDYKNRMLEQRQKFESKREVTEPGPKKTR